MIALVSRILRPKMRNDVLYLPVRDGVYLLNNTSVFTLRGENIYEWVDRIAPFLDGSRTLSELTGGLPADKQTMVADLVSALAERGFVRECADDDPHDLSPADLETFAQEIAFIEYFCDSAERRFQTFRTSRVLVVGSGLTAVALVRAFLQLGVGEVRAAFTGESAVDEAWLAESLADAHQRDPDQRVVRVDPSVDSISDADLVAHVSDRPMLRRSLTLDRLCAERGVAFINGVIVGETAWLGPLAVPGGPGRWEHAWTRVLGNLSPAERSRYAMADHDVEAGEFLTEPTASVACAQLAFEAFKWICGIPDIELTGHLLELDLGLLVGERHRFEPGLIERADAGREATDDFQRRLADGRAGPAIDTESFSRGARNCVDSRCGLFLDVTEGELLQVPLRAARVDLRLPSGETEVVACGMDLTAARAAAARRACELVAATTIDPARLGPGGGVWGVGLRDGEVREVPSGDVFRPEMAVSGPTWEAALRQGLLRIAAVRARHGLAGTARPFPEVALQPQPLTDRGRALLRMLEALGGDPYVLNLTDGRLPILASGTGDMLIAVHADTDPVVALEDALESVVRHCQSELAERPLTDGPQPVALPPDRRGPAGGGLPSAYDSDLAGLADEVLADGDDLLVVPLDHEPALVAFWPHIVALVPTGRHPW
jgi:putative thiazole-containing bacteriocin maturation protein